MNNDIKNEINNIDNIKTENVEFTSNDKETSIHGVIWTNESCTKPVAVLQLVHGMVEYIERYDAFAKFLAGKGFIVCGHDHLGHGHSVKSEKDLGYIADIEHPSSVLVSDIQSMRLLIQNRYPKLPYFILGHSMGSYLLRKYLTDNSKGLAGAIIMGTGYMPNIATNFGLLVCKLQTMLFGAHHRSRLMQKLSYTPAYHKFDTTGRNSSNSWLTKDSSIVEKYYSDPLCTYVFTTNAYKALLETVKYDNKISHLNAIPHDMPIIFVSGSEDPVGNLKKGVLHVYDQYKMCGFTNVNYNFFENDRHEILNETDREEVFNYLYKWLAEHIS